MKLISKELLITLIDYFEEQEAHLTVGLLMDSLVLDYEDVVFCATNYAVLEQFFDAHYDQETGEQYFECVRLPSVQTTLPLSFDDYLEFIHSDGGEENVH